MISEKPYIVSFVSGKGGVGKTMLAVAFAKELSLGSPTLLIDLDFFNRGLSALLGSKEPIAAITIPKPRFLQSEKTAENDTWSVVKVTDNLYHISYSDLQPSDMRKFATLPVESLAEALDEFIQKVAKKCGCSFVVLDCHGGPDNSSFAASIIADHTLLVSEPDRVTFRGTLNFLRQLDTASDERDLQLHLVFNKVVPHFSGFFLKTFYNRAIKSEFGGRPLLGIFPLEVYLTKDFEKHPFLTAVYPNSLLAKKTRLMIHTLFASQEEISLSPAIRKISRPVKWFRMVALGKVPWFLDLANIMFVLTVYVVLFSIGISLGLSAGDGLLRKFFSFFDMSSDSSAFIFLPLVFLLLVAFFFAWFRKLDRKLIYFIRTNRYSLMVLCYFALCTVCFPLAWLYGTALEELLREPTSGLVYSPPALAFMALFLTPVWLVLIFTQVWKTYKLRFERQPLEMALRALFFIYLLIVPYLCTLIPD